MKSLFMGTGRMALIGMEHGQRVWIFWFQNLFRTMGLGIFMCLCQRLGALWIRTVKTIRSRVSLTNLLVRKEWGKREK